MEVAMASVDFAAIKRQFNIEEIAAWLGLETAKANDQLRYPCPVHDGGKRALVITPAKQLWYCFAPKCQKGGDLIELAAHCLKLETREAAIEIQKAFNQKPEPPEGLQKVAEYLEHDHGAVEALGLSEGLATALGIGYAPKGILKGRVLIPLRTADGTLAGYAGYSETLEPKLKLPKTFFV
jgi:DNA primase